MLDISTEILPSPRECKRKIPVSENIFFNIQKMRSQIRKIYERNSTQLIIIAGPCSIHDKSAFYHYAELFHQLLKSVQKNIFLVLRVFSEKSRTSLGWKGYLYDPKLDGTDDLEKGILEVRKILLQLNSLCIPCAMEFVDPLIVPYLDDLICWGFIGARTSSSQPHRLLASSLEIPVGFKNATDGCIDVAINGVLTARSPHRFIGINQEGMVSRIRSFGNPYTHLVLRGSSTKVNYDATSISLAENKLKKLGIEPRIIIDCSHGNCGKNVDLQKTAFSNVMDYYFQNRENTLGMMLESFLFEGSQPFTKFPSYGLSITDPCLDWRSTKELILKANALIEEKLLYVR